MGGDLVRLMGREGAFYPYQVDYGCRFNLDESCLLTDSFSETPDSNYVYTLSVWVKRGNITTGSSQTILGGWSTSSRYTLVGFNTDDTFYVNVTDGGATDKVSTNAVFRDITNWYHIFVAIDTDDGTASNRVKVWVNGVEQTFSGSDYPGHQDFVSWTTSSYETNVGGHNSSATFDGYLAEMHLLDGIAGSVTDFGEFKNGVWVPKEYSGSYGTNGFYLDFSDSADLGADQSGNSNDFTGSGLDADDQVPDTPTNNYCTLNPLDEAGGMASTFANGNLEVDTATGDTNGRATMILDPTEKYYWEVTLANISNSPFSVGTMAAFGAVGASWQSSHNRWIYVRTGHADDGKYWDGSSLSGSSLTTHSQTDILMFASYDNKLWIGKNGTWLNSGDPAAGTGAVITDLEDDATPAWFDAASSASMGLDFDFGQLGFTYTPPTEFKALCVENLPEPAITVPSGIFDILTYTGDGSNPRSITGLDFTPDMVWLKSRNLTESNMVVDSVRGIDGTTDHIYPDLNSVASQNSNGIIDSLDNGGLTVNTGATNDDATNDSGDTYIALCLRKGPSYGLDIVSYTGTGVAHAENHSLGAVPELMIIKDLDAANNWCVYHHHVLSQTDPETDFGYLNTTNAWGDDSRFWNDTAPTASQFTVGTYAAVNTDTNNYIAYLFRSIEGCSKVFSYEGNNDADGPVINCGFRPKWILYKNANNAVNWGMTYIQQDVHYENPVDHYLLPNTNFAENDNSSSLILDVLSNGFKIRGTWSGMNGSGATIVGIAFAELPGKYSNAF